MSNKYKYLDLPDNAPQWLKDAHAAGHTGVWCMVWDDSKRRAENKYVINYKENNKYERFMTMHGGHWRYAEPIEMEPECETIKIKAQPFIGGTSGCQCVALGSLVEEYHKDEPNFDGWNGPEQEIELKVYKPKT